MSDDDRPPTKTRARLLTVGLFVALALAAYANVLGTFFLSDDFAQIGKVVEGDLSVTWGREHGGFFRPLFIFSYFVDTQLWGRHPLGFHLTNVLLHSLNALLVFLLAARLAEREEADETRPTPETTRRETPSFADTTTPGRLPFINVPGRTALAYAAALIFLLHPSHTEAVTWVSGRADLLSTLFCLLALLGFLKHARTRRAAPLALSLLFFALALLSKEAALSFPLLAALVGAFLTEGSRGATTTSDTRTTNPTDARTTPTALKTFGRATFAAFKRGALAALPFMCVLAAYVLARAAALGTLVGGYGAGRHLYLTHGVVASQLLRALMRLAFPAVALRSLPFLESRALSPTLIVTGALLLVASAVALGRARTRRSLARFARRNRLAWLLVALSVAALLPALNLRINVYDTQGERFLYLPSVFFSVLVARALTNGPARAATVRRAALVCLLLLYALGLWTTNRTWREASAFSRRLVADVVGQSTRGDVLILNAPDNLRGAYVFRNGFEQALRTFQDERPFARVAVVAAHDAETRDDAVEVKEEAGVLSVTLLNPRASFGQTAAETPCAHVVEASARVLRLRLEDCAAGFDLFYFSSGRMRKAGATR